MGWDVLFLELAEGVDGWHTRGGGVWGGEMGVLELAEADDDDDDDDEMTVVMMIMMMMMLLLLMMMMMMMMMYDDV